MKDREKILRYFSASGEEAGETAVRLLDIAAAAETGRPFAVSPFLSPFAVQIGMTIAAHMKTVVCKSFGGFHEAERVRIAFVRDDYTGPVDFGITALKATWDDRYRLIGHRDVLGSLMGLGIERDVLGDIIMDGAGAQILVDTKMAPWICENFTKVAMVPVSVSEMPLDDKAGSETNPRDGRFAPIRRRGRRGIRHFPLENGGRRGRRAHFRELAGGEKRVADRESRRCHRLSRARTNRNQGAHRAEPQRPHRRAHRQI